MIIYHSSDIHQGPDGYKPVVYNFLEEVYAKADMLIDTGDMFDAVRYGWGNIVQSASCKKLADYISQVATKVQVAVIPGNHDYGLEQMDMFSKDVVISSELLVVDPKLRIKAVHGWREYDLSLSWVRRIYGSVFHLLPQFAWIYDKLFSSPGQMAAQEKNFNDTYWRFVLHTQYLAMFDAIKNNTAILHGHDHNRSIHKTENWYRIDAGTAQEPRQFGIVIRDGVPEYWTWK